MSYESVISHQPRAPFRMIRHDYVNICSEAPDAVCAALLLDLAEAWTNHVMTENEKKQAAGIEAKETEPWFFRAEEDIKADLFNAYGINKLRSNRQWLINQGLLKHRQTVREQGGFYNEYLLNIEALQAKINGLPPVKNNERPEAKRPLKITDAPVKNNDKKEVIKESIEKENSVALPQVVTADGKKPTQAKPYYDAIASYTKLEGALNVNLEKMLQGKATDPQHKPYNLPEPMALPEFLEWAADWRKENFNLKFLQSPAKIQSSVLAWRKAKQQKAKPVANIIPVAMPATGFQNLATDGVVVFNRPVGVR